MALQLGRTPSELLDSISSAELTELWAEYCLEPWGDARDDLRMGILATQIHRAAGSKREDGAPIVPSDFMPFVERPNPGETLAAKIRNALKPLMKPKRKRDGISR